MPLVRIDVPRGRSADQHHALGEAVYQAMVQTLNVPANDRFVVIQEHGPSTLQIDPSYLGVARSPNAIVVQVTLNAGRTVELKRAFYARTVELLAEQGVRPEDVLISLIEVVKENWSFGMGQAQYAPLE